MIGIALLFKGCLFIKEAKGVPKCYDKNLLLILTGIEL